MTQAEVVAVHPLLQRILDELATLAKAEWEQDDSYRQTSLDVHQAVNRINGRVDLLCSLLVGTPFTPAEVEQIRFTVQPLLEKFKEQAIGCDSKVRRILDALP